MLCLIAHFYRLDKYNFKHHNNLYLIFHFQPHNVRKCPYILSIKYKFETGTIYLSKQHTRRNTVTELIQLTSTHSDAHEKVVYLIQPNVSKTFTITT